MPKAQSLQARLDKAQDDILVLLVCLQHTQQRPIHWQDAALTADAPPCRISFQSLRSRYHSILERYEATGLKQLQASSAQERQPHPARVKRTRLSLTEPDRFTAMTTTSASASQAAGPPAKRQRLSENIARRMQAAETDEPVALTDLSSNPPRWFQEQQAQRLQEVTRGQGEKNGSRHGGISARELRDLTMPELLRRRPTKRELELAQGQRPIVAHGVSDTIAKHEAIETPSLVLRLKVDYRRHRHLLSSVVRGPGFPQVSLRRPAPPLPLQSRPSSSSTHSRTHTHASRGSFPAGFRQKMTGTKRESSDLSSPPASSSSSLSSPVTQPGWMPWRGAAETHEATQLGHSSAQDGEGDWMLPQFQHHTQAATAATSEPSSGLLQTTPNDGNIQILADTAHLLANKHYEEEMRTMMLQRASSDDGFAMLQCRLSLEQRAGSEEAEDWSMSRE